jgi:hypothetical protein
MVDGVAYIIKALAFNFQHKVARTWSVAKGSSPRQLPMTVVSYEKKKSPNGEKAGIGRSCLHNKDLRSQFWSKSGKNSVHGEGDKDNPPLKDPVSFWL